MKCSQNKSAPKTNCARNVYIKKTMSRSRSPKRAPATPAPQPQRECPICYDAIPLDDIVKLDCHETHQFHNSCFTEWLLATGTPSCPFCRTKVDIEKYALGLTMFERLRVYVYIFVGLVLHGFGLATGLYRTSVLFRNVSIGTVIVYVSGWDILRRLFGEVPVFSWLLNPPNKWSILVRLFITVIVFSKINAGWPFDFTFATLGRVIEQLLLGWCIEEMIFWIKEHNPSNKRETAYVKRIHSNLSIGLKICYFVCISCLGAIWLWYLPSIADWVFDTVVEKLNPLLQVLVNRD